MPEISVIVPVYNVEQYLRRCVDSILAQTFADFELILVDDGSPDNCGTICDEYAVQDSRVHVIHQENGGVSAARNEGIDWVFVNSDSQWITFVDSDDWVHPDYLGLLLKGVQHYHVRISSGKYLRTERMVSYSIAQPEMHLKSAESVYSDDGKEIKAYPWVRLFDKTLFEHVRFPEGKLFEDTYTTYKIFFAVDQIAVIDVPLYYYFVNMDGITKSRMSLKKLDYLKASEEVIQFLEQNHYMMAYKTAVKAYLRALIVYAKEVEEELHEEEIAKQLLKRMREVFFKARKKCDITPRNLPECYDALFPRSMAVYWFVGAQFSKLRRLIGK